MADYMPRLSTAMREPEELLPHFETPLVPRIYFRARAYRGRRYYDLPCITHDRCGNTGQPSGGRMAVGNFP